MQDYTMHIHVGVLLLCWPTLIRDQSFQRMDGKSRVTSSDWQRNTAQDSNSAGSRAQVILARGGLGWMDVSGCVWMCPGVQDLWDHILCFQSPWHSLTFSDFLCSDHLESSCGIGVPQCASSEVWTPVEVSHMSCNLPPWIAGSAVRTGHTAFAENSRFRSSECECIISIHELCMTIVYRILYRWIYETVWRKIQIHVYIYIYRCKDAATVCNYLQLWAPFFSQLFWDPVTSRIARCQWQSTRSCTVWCECLAMVVNGHTSAEIQVRSTWVWARKEMNWKWWEDVPEL